LGALDKIDALAKCIRGGADIICRELDFGVEV
jgi:hypothetical protein